MAKKKSKDDRCAAPGPDGKRCPKPIHIKKLKLCNAHYQQVYHHGEITNNPVGRKPSELRKRTKELYRNYRGKEAFYDIKKKLEAEGFDKYKVEKVVWDIVRGPKSTRSS